MNLTSNNLGENEENLKYLGETIKYLPDNLQSFTIILLYNNLGGQTNNDEYYFKYFGEALK